MRTVFIIIIIILPCLEPLPYLMMSPSIMVVIRRKRFFVLKDCFVYYYNDSSRDIVKVGTKPAIVDGEDVGWG